MQKMQTMKQYAKVCISVEKVRVESISSLLNHFQPEMTDDLLSLLSAKLGEEYLHVIRTGRYSPICGQSCFFAFRVKSSRIIIFLRHTFLNLYVDYLLFKKIKRIKATYQKSKTHKIQHI